MLRRAFIIERDCLARAVLDRANALDESLQLEHIVQAEMICSRSHSSRLISGLVTAIWIFAASYGLQAQGQNNALQKPGPPAVELLTLSGGQVVLPPNGEGITSFKTSYIYKL